MRSRAAFLLTITAAIACGDCKSTTGPTPQPTPGVLQVAGQYQITQQAATDTCGQTGQPAAVSGTVTHTGGTSTFTLADTGGTTFTGTVPNNGDFSANAVFGPDAQGQTFTQQLQGRFTTNGFTAALRVQVSPRNCEFTRNWTATKSGSPNVFP